MPGGDPRQRGAALMKTNMERIDHIVEDILFVARSPEPRLTPGLLRPLIEEETGRWELTLANKNITLQQQRASDCPPIPFDRDQIARALSNLIGNSIHALSPGGQIDLTLIQKGDEQVITVADNGPGISPEHLPHIFEPFYTTKSRGAGLGLSVVKQIVDFHQGQIEVWSQSGKGTRFTITLSPDTS
jgi:signal transduction histidine kinase